MRSMEACSAVSETHPLAFALFLFFFFFKVGVFSRSYNSIAIVCFSCRLRVSTAASLNEAYLIHMPLFALNEPFTHWLATMIQLIRGPCGPPHHHHHHQGHCGFSKL